MTKRIQTILLLIVIALFPSISLSQTDYCEDCPDCMAMLVPDKSAIPTIDTLEIENLFNEIELTKKYKVDSFYISLSFIVDLKGNVYEFDFVKGEIPFTGHRLNDKKLTQEFQSIIEKIVWIPGLDKGESVCSVNMINFKVKNGTFRIFKKTPYNNASYSIRVSDGLS